MKWVDKALFAWTALNLLVSGYILFPYLQFVLSNPLHLASMLLSYVMSFWVLWLLTKPSFKAYMIGTIYWALQIFLVKIGPITYGFVKGIYVRFPIEYGPDITVYFNLLGLATCLVFSYQLSRFHDNNEPETKNSN